MAPALTSSRDRAAWSLRCGCSATRSHRGWRRPRRPSWTAASPCWTTVRRAAPCCCHAAGGRCSLCGTGRADPSRRLTAAGPARSCHVGLRRRLPGAAGLHVPSAGAALTVPTRDLHRAHRRRLAVGAHARRTTPCQLQTTLAVSLPPGAPRTVLLQLTHTRPLPLSFPSQFLRCTGSRAARREGSRPGGHQRAQLGFQAHGRCADS